MSQCGASLGADSEYCKRCGATLGGSQLTSDHSNHDQYRAATSSTTASTALSDERPMEAMVLAVLAVWAGLELLGLGPALGNYESFLFPAHEFLFGVLSAGLGVLNLVAAYAY